MPRAPGRSRAARRRPSLAPARRPVRSRWRRRTRLWTLPGVSTRTLAEESRAGGGSSLPWYDSGRPAEGLFYGELETTGEAGANGGARAAGEPPLPHADQDAVPTPRPGGRGGRRGARLPVAPPAHGAARPRGLTQGDPQECRRAKEVPGRPDGCRRPQRGVTVREPLPWGASAAPPARQR